MAVECLIKAGFMGNRKERTVDTQWSNFSAQRASIGALEVLKHAISIGDEIGRHLNGR